MLVKPFKAIFVLFVGFCVLGALAYVCALLVFPKTMTGKVALTEQDSVSSPSSGAGEDMGAPDYRDGKSILPVPSYMPGIGDGSKIVKNASISVTVKDFDSTVSSLKADVASFNGFVQSLTDSGLSNDRVVMITVRVPADKYDEVLNKIKGYAATVEKLNEGSDDISAAYKDVQARLKNQKALEKQLLVLLDKATKVDDILAVQTQLSYVREQIEMYEGQIKMYDNQVNMSGISVVMTKSSEALSVTDEQWKPLGVVMEAFTALVAFGKGLITLGIWILVFSPIVLIPAAMVWYAKRNKK